MPGRPQGFTSAVCLPFLQFGSWCAGEIEWRPANGSWRGELELTAFADVLDLETAQLVYVLRPRIPTRPTVNLLLNGANAYRLDVNQAHRCQGTLLLGSHWQFRTSSEGPPHYEVCGPEVTAVLDEPPVPDGTYYRLLRDFARRCNISLQGTIWVDPPGGEP